MADFSTTGVAFSPLSSNQRQWIRRIRLVAGDAAGSGVDLSDLQIRFRIASATTQTPRQLEARIYNLSSDTSRTIEQEFTQVQLSAGYQNGPFGILFTGAIAQVRRGRENAVDSFVDIVAADGDFAYNWAVINTTLAKGWTRSDQQKALVQAMNQQTGYSPNLPAAQAPRGKVLYGPAKDHLRGFGAATGTQWGSEDGKINFVPEIGYIPGETIILNSASGMVGVPEQTIDGVTVRCLLNPNIRTGRLLQIDNASITSTTLKSPVSANDPFFLPSLDADGMYKVYALHHLGDSRGQEWYTEAVCVAINGTAPLTSTYTNAVVNGQ